jgi:magnesium-protoporphyrin IX monomethyl ester (oxidative) cyclase
MASRILLVYPPSRFQGHDACPAGLLYLAAVLEKAGHNVRVVDANSASKRRTVEDMASVAREYQPDLVGMTIVTQLAREAYQLASLLKASGIPLLAGGPHPSLVPEEPLRFGFDAVCIGDGEPVIIDAIAALLGQIPVSSVRGLVYRDTRGRTCFNPPAQPIDDLDSLPEPARHLIPAHDYHLTGSPNQYGNIFSSRGCPCRCSYCAGGLFGRRFRFRSATSVLNEIAGVHKAYGTMHFHFVDDGMTVDRKRATVICQGLSSLNLGITWSMMTRIDTVDAEFLALAARSGCVRIDYGAESGSTETLKRIHKPHTVSMIKKTVAETHRAGITPQVFFMVGFPWETPSHIKSTLSLMQDLSPYVSGFHHALASILLPFPGTELFESYKDQYDLHEWWLKADRSFGSPVSGHHAYFEEQLFPLGVVLDADFFRYSKEVRGSIYDTMAFMHRKNNSRRGLLARSISNGLTSLSRMLWSVSPRSERVVFTAYHRLRQFLYSS